jgi:pentatricopeptide repeat protein
MGVSRARFALVRGLPINSDARLIGTRAIAHCFMEAGEHSKALTVLTALELGLAKEHPHSRGLTDILGDKATAQYGLKRFDEHKDTLYKILSSRGDRPDTDPLIMEANSQLALWLLSAKDGDMGIAEEHARNAVKASSMGTDQMKQLIYKNTLVGVLAKRRRYEKALDLLAEMLAEARRVFGPDHEMTLMVLHNIAAYTIRAGKVELYRESADIARSVYEKRLATIGAAHPDTLTSRGVLVSALEKLGVACAYPNCGSVVESKLLCPRCKRVKYCTDACRVADSARHAGCERKGAHTKRG